MVNGLTDPDDSPLGGADFEKEVLGGLFPGRIVTIPSQEALDSVFWREKFIENDEVDDSYTYFYDVDEGDYSACIEPGEELQLLLPRQDGSWFCRLKWINEDNSSEKADIVVPGNYLKILIELIEDLEIEKGTVSSELNDALALFREKFGLLIGDDSLDEPVDNQTKNKLEPVKPIKPEEETETKKMEIGVSEIKEKLSAAIKRFFGR